jgi:hypothetical protein
MFVSQVLTRVNNTVEISFHQLCNYVNVFEACAAFRLFNVCDRNNILVVKKLKQLDLSHDSLSVNEVLKGFGYLMLNITFLMATLVLPLLSVAEQTTP